MPNLATNRDLPGRVRATHRSVDRPNCLPVVPLTRYTLVFDGL
jgi:hypothetical protein